MQSSLTLEPNPFEQSFAPHTADAAPTPGPAIEITPGSGATASSAGTIASNGPAGHSEPATTTAVSSVPGTVEDKRADIAKAGGKAIPGINKIATPLPLIPGQFHNQYGPQFQSQLAGLGQIHNGMGPGNTTPGWSSLRAGPVTPGILGPPGYPLPSPGVPGVPLVPLETIMGRAGPTQQLPTPQHGENLAANGLYMLSSAGTGASGVSDGPGVAGVSNGDPAHAAASSTIRANKKAEDGAETSSNSKRRRKMTNEAGHTGIESEAEDKRKQFLERNRLAALKCRQRKKQWVDELKGKVDGLSETNDRLVAQNTRLLAQVDQLRHFVVANHDVRTLPQMILAILDRDMPVNGP